MADTSFILIRGARENNLKNISINIPKKAITVFTGVSGSGKSSLVFDTIAAESQRQLNETFSSFIRHRLPHYGQPDADVLQNLSAAIIVDQKRIGGNARSTVGTTTDIYTLLRLLFSRIGKPFVGHSSVFSFNHPQGMCLQCEGLGTVTTIDIDLFFDKTKSLNEGAFRFPTFAKGTVRWKRYVLSGLFDNDKKLAKYSKQEWETLLYAKNLDLKHPLPGYPASAKFEGVLTRFERNYLSRETKDLHGLHKEAFERILTKGTCPLCKGARLNKKVLSSKIAGYSIADYAGLQIDELIEVVSEINQPNAHTITTAIIERLKHLVAIGLSYLFLNRETSSLSGGESQRVKMVKHLGSSLTDITYIFDEPSVGLHPKDVHQLNSFLKVLRDKGNTVLVVEHDPDVIAIADHIVDMGPNAGRHGGKIVYEGNLAGLATAGTLTGIYWNKNKSIKTAYRKPNGFLTITNGSLHNVKHVNVKIPKGILTVVTGVAGSGKSSLINGILPKIYTDIICIDQSAITGNRRSNPATYTGILDPVRKLFAAANKVSVSLFSSNADGACPECKGIGTITLDLSFMDPITTTCELCNGKQFADKVLHYQLRGKNIYEVLKLTIAEAKLFFQEPEIHAALVQLDEVGLDYLTLGQPLNSLSGGERQRIKLASEMESRGGVYIMDEPTTGLHMSDVDKLLLMVNRIVDNGSTVVIIEHNLEVISQADWIIEMGPGAGKNGGKITFNGVVADLVNNNTSDTGKFLKRSLKRDYTSVDPYN